MTNPVTDNTGTTPVREGYRFDEASLDHWMRQQRALRRTAASAQAKERAAMLPELARLGWEQAEARGREV